MNLHTLVFGWLWVSVTACGKHLGAVTNGPLAAVASLVVEWTLGCVGMVVVAHLLSCSVKHGSSWMGIKPMSPAL